MSGMCYVILLQDMVEEGTPGMGTRSHGQFNISTTGGKAPTVAISNWFVTSTISVRKVLTGGFGFRLMGILVKHPRYKDEDLAAKPVYWTSTEVTGGDGKIVHTNNRSNYSLIGLPQVLEQLPNGERKFEAGEAEALKQFCERECLPLQLRNALSQRIKSVLGVAAEESASRPEQPQTTSPPVVVVNQKSNPIPAPIPKRPTSAVSTVKQGVEKITVASKSAKAEVIRSLTGHRICIHHIRQSMCRDCDGKSICSHGKQRNWCVECGGSARCAHGRQKSKCKDCGGRGFCPHGKFKYRCPSCKGG